MVIAVSGSDTPVTAEARDVYTVSRLNREAKQLLEGTFPLIWIEGEISNLSRPASGHLYFSLKDEQAQIRCALFRGNQRGLACTPRDGLHVVARARVSLYEGRGDFQLIVETVEEAGEGRLRLAFEALKRRLGAEGLFDAARKKARPRVPARIGVVTSPSGAAIRDVLTTLRRRFPAIPVIVYPVPVQGDAAAPAIAAALARAGQRGECDVLILARGGGSLEDLWAFNEEIVARAIFACPIPVVTGVGHEVDVTIADFVADARAATPTAAAELVSPDAREWLGAFAALEARLLRRMRDRVNYYSQRVDGLRARIVHPRARLGRMEERLAGLRMRMRHTMRAAIEARRVAALDLDKRLAHRSPALRIREAALHVRRAREMLRARMQARLARAQTRLEHASARLDAYNPLATLARGYAVVTDAASGAVLRDAGQVKRGDAIVARLAHGQLRARVEESDQ
jgi:exodeoxyribonuclease VII large subunit